ADCGEHLVGAEDAAGAVVEAEALEAREREHHRVEAVAGAVALELSEARLHVAADRDDLDVGAHRPDLRGAAEAARADAGALRQIFESAAVARAKGVARILPL